MTHKDSFDWLDVLLKRWQIMVAIASAIIWLTTLQIQVASGNSQSAELKSEMRSMSSIQAEWPYLKARVEDVNKKVDKIDDKLDVLLSRA